MGRNAPGTKRYILIVEDPDAPGGPFRHWALFDIDPSCDHLDEAELIGVYGAN